MAEMSTQSELKLKSKLYIDGEKVRDLIGKPGSGEEVEEVEEVNKMMTKAFGCNGKDQQWIRSFIDGLKSSNEIDSDQTIENLEELSNIINEVGDKLQKITQDAKYYFLEEEADIKNFIDICNNLCERIDTYSKGVKEKNVQIMSNGKQTKFKLTDKYTLHRYFQSIKFLYLDEFNNKYKLAKQFLKRREDLTDDQKTEDSKAPKFFTNILSGNTTKVLTKLWELKIYLYITGVLIYNIQLYMFPPSINSMLDNLIKIFGVICYTASTDPVIFNNCVKIINTIIMKLGSLAFMCISPFLFAIIDSQFLQGVNSVMSYIFTIYCFGWLSKILVAICNTITVFKPAVDAGVTSTSQTLSTVIQVVKDAGISTQEFGLNVGTYAITMFAQMSPAILEGFLVFFTNYAATTASSVYKYLQNKFDAGTDSVARLINSILSTWTGTGKQIVQFKTVQTDVDVVRHKPFMIIDNSNQVVATELLKLILNKKEIGKVFEGDSATGLDQQILTTDNLLFNYAITVNDQGQYFIDPNVIHENLQNMIQINITDIVDKRVNDTITNVTKTFNDNFDTAIRAAGLTLLVKNMSDHLNSDNANIPGMILLSIFQAGNLYNLISTNAKSIPRVILSVAIICVVLAIVTLK